MLNQPKTLHQGIAAAEHIPGSDTCSQEVESVTDAWHAVGVGGTFTIPLANTIIDYDETITECSILVENVTVENNSKLTLNFTNSVVINGEFEVEAGSELEVY